MRTLDKRLDALERATHSEMPTRWRWVIAENAEAVEQAKADHVALYGDMPGAGWIISFLAPAQSPAGHPGM